MPSGFAKHRPLQQGSVPPAAAGEQSTPSFSLQPPQYASLLVEQQYVVVAAVQVPSDWSWEYWQAQAEQHSLAAVQVFPLSSLTAPAATVPHQL